MQADEVTAAVKRKLNVTWSEPDTDARIDDVIRKSKATLRRLCICPKDIEQWDDEDIGLLLDAALYEFSNAADDFRRNYADAIQSCRLKHEVAEQVAPDA